MESGRRRGISTKASTSTRQGRHSVGGAQVGAAGGRKSRGGGHHGGKKENGGEKTKERSQQKEKGEKSGAGRD